MMIGAQVGLADASARKVGAKRTAQAVAGPGAPGSLVRLLERTVAAEREARKPSAPVRRATIAEQATRQAPAKPGSVTVKAASGMVRQSALARREPSLLPMLDSWLWTRSQAPGFERGLVASIGARRDLDPRTVAEGLRLAQSDAGRRQMAGEVEAFRARRSRVSETTRAARALGNASVGLEGPAPVAAGPGSAMGRSMDLFTGLLPEDDPSVQPTSIGERRQRLTAWAYDQRTRQATWPLEVLGALYNDSFNKGVTERTFEAVKRQREQALGRRLNMHERRDMQSEISGYHEAFGTSLLAIAAGGLPFAKEAGLKSAGVVAEGLAATQGATEGAFLATNPVIADEEVLNIPGIGPVTGSQLGLGMIALEMLPYAAGPAFKGAAELRHRAKNRAAEAGVRPDVVEAAGEAVGAEVEARLGPEAAQVWREDAGRIAEEAERPVRQGPRVQAADADDALGGLDGELDAAAADFQAMLGRRRGGPDAGPAPAVRPEPEPEGPRGPAAGPVEVEAAPRPAGAREVYLDPDSIGVDPEIQFKQNIADRDAMTTKVIKKGGVFNADPSVSGTITVWERLDGQRFVAHGHHRLAIAKNAARFVVQEPQGLVESPDGRVIRSKVLREADGWDKDTVRVIAALENVQAKTAEPLEVALVLKKAGLTLDDLKDRGIDLSEALVRDAMALQTLDMATLDWVRANKITQAAAAGVASVDGLAPDRIRKILEQANEQRYRTYDDARSFAKQKQRSMAKTMVDGGLFGFEEAEVDSTPQQVELIKKAKEQTVATWKRLWDGLKVQELEGETLRKEDRRAMAEKWSSGEANLREKVFRAFDKFEDLQDFVIEQANDWVTGKQTQDEALANVKRRLEFELENTPEKEYAVGRKAATENSSGRDTVRSGPGEAPAGVGAGRSGEAAAEGAGPAAEPVRGRVEPEPEAGPAPSTKAFSAEPGSNKIPLASAMAEAPYVKEVAPGVTGYVVEVRGGYQAIFDELGRYDSSSPIRNGIGEAAADVDAWAKTKGAEVQPEPRRSNLPPLAKPKAEAAKKPAPEQGKATVAGDLYDAAVQLQAKAKIQHSGAIVAVKVGDFYEFYGADAVEAGQTLGVAVTRRSFGPGNVLELVGIPEYALEKSLKKFVGKGKRVAVIGASKEAYVGGFVEGPATVRARVVEPEPVRRREGARLPAALKGAKPRYSFGQKRFTLAFESDVDMAAYIVSQPKPSKSDAKYLRFVMDALGVDEAGARAYGGDVRARIKEMARVQEPGEIRVRSGQAVEPEPVRAVEPGPQARLEAADVEPVTPRVERAPVGANDSVVRARRREIEETGQMTVDAVQDLGGDGRKALTFDRLMTVMQNAGWREAMARRAILSLSPGWMVRIGSGAAVMPTARVPSFLDYVQRVVEGAKPGEVEGLILREAQTRKVLSEMDSQKAGDALSDAAELDGMNADGLLGRLKEIAATGGTSGNRAMAATRVHARLIELAEAEPDGVGARNDVRAAIQGGGLAAQEAARMRSTMKALESLTLVREREDLAAALEDQFRLGADEVEAVMALTDARAMGWAADTGRNADEWYGEHIKLVTGDRTKFQGEQFQDAKAAVFFQPDSGKALIFALESPDVSSAVHELAHVFRRQMPDETSAVVLESLGAEKWDVDAEERFARGFELYVRQGKAPSEGLRAVFERFREWLTAIYQKVTGGPLDVKITPQMRAAFEGLLDVQGFGRRSELAGEPVDLDWEGRSVRLTPGEALEFSAMKTRHRERMARVVLEAERLMPTEANELVGAARAEILEEQGGFMRSTVWGQADEVWEEPAGGVSGVDRLEDARAAVEAAQRQLRIDRMAVQQGVEGARVQAQASAKRVKYALEEMARIKARTGDSGPLFQRSAPPVKGWAKRAKEAIESIKNVGDAAEVGAAYIARFIQGPLDKIKLHGAPGTPARAAAKELGARLETVLMDAAGREMRESLLMDEAIRKAFKETGFVGWVAKGKWKFSKKNQARLEEMARLIHRGQPEKIEPELRPVYDAWVQINRRLIEEAAGEFDPKLLGLSPLESIGQGVWVDRTNMKVPDQLKRNFVGQTASWYGRGPDGNYNNMFGTIIDVEDGVLVAMTHDEFVHEIKRYERFSTRTMVKPENFFPRRIKKEIMRALQREAGPEFEMLARRLAVMEDQGVTEWQDALNSLTSRLSKARLAQAKQAVREILAHDNAVMDVSGGYARIEKERLPIELPEEFYDFDFYSVAQSHVRQASTRLALAAEFDQQNLEMQNLIQRMKEMAPKAAQELIEATMGVRRVDDIDAFWRKVAGWEGAWQVASKLTGLTTTLLQVAQSAGAVGILGGRPYLKTMGDFAKMVREPEGRAVLQEIRESGTISNELTRLMAVEDEASMASLIAETAMKITGIGPLDTALRYQAALTGVNTVEMASQRWAKARFADGAEKRLLENWFQYSPAELDMIRLNPEAALRDAAIRRKAMAGGVKTQINARAADMPKFWQDNAAFRIAFRFQSFNYGQMRLLNFAAQEAARGNPRVMTRLMAAYLAAGWLTLEGRDQIVAWQTDSVKRDRDQNWAQKAAFYLMQGGFFGMMAAPLEGMVRSGEADDSPRATTEKLRQSIQDSVIPPAMSDLLATAGAVNEGLKAQSVQAGLEKWIRETVVPARRLMDRAQPTETMLKAEREALVKKLVTAGMDPAAASAAARAKLPPRVNRYWTKEYRAYWTLREANIQAGMTTEQASNAAKRQMGIPRIPKVFPGDPDKN